MPTQERKIRIAWVETDAELPVEQAEAPLETPAVVDEAERQRVEAAHERTWSIVLWVGTCGLFTALEAWILPEFAKMFREVGVHLPAMTEAALGTPGWIYALGVLSLLHAAAITRSAETRGQLRVAAFLGVALGLGLTAYALFLPLISLNQKL